MLTRRHLRVKVMQCIYSLSLASGGSLEKQQEFLNRSIGQTYTLYLLVLALFRELYQAAVDRSEKATSNYLKMGPGDRGNPLRLSQNKILQQISENPDLTEALKKRKLKQWYLNEEYIKIVLSELLESDLYNTYAQKPESYEADREFLVQAFREIIAPNEKVYEFLEDEEITWVDDLPLVNTHLLKQLRKVKPESPNNFFLPPLLKNKEDVTFATELLNKTLLNGEELAAEIEGQTPNWDKDRIAEIDAILLKMAIAELLYFPSIPERVSINEYLEIAKEYSTPKSSIFINGVLDKLTKDYQASGRLKKTGRGLL